MCMRTMLQYITLICISLTVMFCLLHTPPIQYRKGVAVSYNPLLKICNGASHPFKQYTFPRRNLHVSGIAIAKINSNKHTTNNNISYTSYGRV